jgi:protein-L-isoaspartate(D-aspartate) O-methyltransferase
MSRRIGLAARFLERPRAAKIVNGFHMSLRRGKTGKTIFFEILSLVPLILLGGCGDGALVESARSTAEPPFPPSATRSATDRSDPYLAARLNMVRNDIEARGVANPDVLEAMRTVPREKFVPPEYLGMAYGDYPLPIGYGQTISQPYIVAWMTELLDLKPGDKVLEIGTGSGYQAAVLAQLGYVDVYTIEIVPELERTAAQQLKDLGYTRVQVKQGDGYYGWPEYAPFDAIIVTAAPDHLPAPLAAQLAGGGRLVIPIGPPGGFQTLWKFVKDNGELKAYNQGGVSFVPFTGAGVEGKNR